MAMIKGPQFFPKEEYLERLAKTKNVMREAEVDALLVTLEAYTIYLTGYVAGSAYVPQAVIVLLDDEEPVFVMRQQDTAAGYYQSWLSKDRLIGYPEDAIGIRNDPMRPVDTMIDYLCEVGMSGKRIGYAGPFFAPDKFANRMPDAVMVDCSEAFNASRVVKSDLEIATMREGAAIADAAIARAAEVIHVGNTQAEASAEIMAQLIRGANGKNGMEALGFYFCASPVISSSHISWEEDSPLREGQQVNLEIAGNRHKYMSAISRTFSIGAPSDKLLRYHEAELAGLEAALQVAQAGAYCKDVAIAFNAELVKRGLPEKESRCGYNIGINWNENYASFRDDDMTVLVPNMTFHMMLGNWTDEDFGYVISETIRITEKGPAEPLTKSPRELFIV